MAFSFIWDEYPTMNIIGRWLNVWQGSCKAKNGQRKSHCGVEERWTTKQISGRRRGFFLINRGF
jgi:hypothetical protein